MPEAEQARRRVRLQFGGERCEFGQQAMIVDEPVGAPHLVSHLREPPLDVVDRGSETLRLRQTKKRERPVGFELYQPLHQCAGALRCHAAVEHEDAHETRCIGPKVGGE